MVTIALYSNDSAFLTSFSQRLGRELQRSAQPFFQFRFFSPFQTSLFAETDKPSDLCVVDLRDDPEGGMEFAAHLRQSSSSEVIVVAPSPDYAMAAYNADILSYLLDPPDPVRTAKLILRRFVKSLPSEEEQFPFKTASGVQLLPAQRIVYVEYSDHRMIVYTDYGKRLVTTTMRLSFAAAAARLLEDGRFVRTHASFIVNIFHISEFGQAVLQMDTGVSVPISHAKRREVKEHFNRFFGGR